MLRKTSGFTLIEIMVVILIIALLISMALPNFFKAREKSRASTCRANLRMISTAKEQWAMDNRKTGNDTPQESDLVSVYIKGKDGKLPSCPSAGNYDIGSVNSWPTCSVGTNGTVDPIDDHIFAN